LIENIPGRLISPNSIEARERANNEEEVFRQWDENLPYPSSSMPAQIAGKCALLQGKESFECFHGAVFRAFFRDCRDISNGEILASVAAEAGLDVERFRVDYSSGLQKNWVLAEYEKGRSEYEGWGVPLVIVGGRFPLVGAVPIEMYRRAIDLCLVRQ
jgi:predicted DsbA family dithiol-disulfide isomerase